MHETILDLQIAKIKFCYNNSKVLLTLVRLLLSYFTCTIDLDGVIFLAIEGCFSFTRGKRRTRDQCCCLIEFSYSVDIHVRTRQVADRSAFQEAAAQDDAVNLTRRGIPRSSNALAASSLVNARSVPHMVPFHEKDAKR